MKKQDSTFQKISLARIFPNPEQPRKEFTQAELLELADSIVEHGVIKPIAIEEAADGNYVIHDGERRWRAAKMAGLQQIPAMVHPPLNGTGPQERLTRAIVANIQAESMNPVDLALAYKRLRDEFGFKVREISKKIGKKESSIYNSLELAELQAEILDLMRAKRLPTDSTVVRALHSVINIKDRIKLAQELAERKSAMSTIIAACRNYNALRPMTARRSAKEKNPAQRSLEEINANLPEWDALYQLGKVPKFSVLNDVVMNTCDICTLRKIASENICGGCALVVTLQGLMEAVHA